MAQHRSKYWTWCLNAPRELDAEHQLAWLLEAAEKCKLIDCLFLCFKGERVTNGHLQGYIQFPMEMNRNAVKDLFPSKIVHLDKSFGSPMDNIIYVTKEETSWGVPYFEKGSLDLNEPGSRSLRSTNREPRKHASAANTKCDWQETKDNYSLPLDEDWINHVLEGPEEDEKLYKSLDKLGELYPELKKPVWWV